MNARSYRVDMNISPLDFPPIMGLGQSSVAYQSEPPYIIHNKVVLVITMKYILIDMGNNQEYEIILVQSVYEIPANELKSREDVYEFYKDATLSINEAYQYIKKKLPALPSISFPYQPVENYQREIDRVFDLLK